MKNKTLNTLMPLRDDCLEGGTPTRGMALTAVGLSRSPRDGKALLSDVSFSILVTFTAVFLTLTCIVLQRKGRAG
jgi:hypothetical protein